MAEVSFTVKLWLCSCLFIMHDDPADFCINAMSGVHYGYIILVDQVSINVYSRKSPISHLLTEKTEPNELTKYNV